MARHDCFAMPVKEDAVEIRTELFAEVWESQGARLQKSQTALPGTVPPIVSDHPGRPQRRDDGQVA